MEAYQNIKLYRVQFTENKIVKWATYKIRQKKEDKIKYCV